MAPIVNKPVRQAKLDILKLNEGQAKVINAQIGSELYWREQGAFGKPINKRVEAKLKRLEKYFESLLGQEGVFKPELNSRGCVIKRSSHPQRGRYYYDHKLLGQKNGWCQYDTDEDAGYFGVWVNVLKMEVITYCEGDVSHVLAQNSKLFKAELRSLVDYYNPSAFATTFDNEGNKKVYYEQNEVHDYLRINVMDKVQQTCH